MSRFFSEKYRRLVPYTPGEQPRDRKYVKLNTNESPFPPSPGVAAAVAEEADLLELYSDPECTALRAAMAEAYDVTPLMVVMTNGSDEALNFAFMAFADDRHPLRFADITYGFYPVFAALNGIPANIVPLSDDFSIVPDDYIGVPDTVVIANPNAPTGRLLPLSDIERIVSSDPDRIVIIDEAYIDFGGESAVRLTRKYRNLLVVGTFSKSRSMAGARLGFAIGDPALIADINTIRYSTNPYNVNRMSAAAGAAALRDSAYYARNCRTICENRAWTSGELRKLGFDVLPSSANFVFARTDAIGGGELYGALKERGVLVRHFDSERISDYCRITIGSREQMETLIRCIGEIIGGICK
jgi:histidinol-phosphate aminotransferase